MNNHKSSESMSNDLNFVEDALANGLDFATKDGQQAIRDLLMFMKKTMNTQQSMLAQ